MGSRVPEAGPGPAVIALSTDEPLRLTATDRPRVLAVTSEVPWPLDSGGHLRTYPLFRALAARLQMRVVAPTPSDQASANAAALRAAGVEPRLVEMPARTGVGEAIKALRAGLTGEPYVMFARHRHRGVRQTLEREMARQAPHAIYLDHLDSLVYAGVRPRIPLVVDMHNVYSRLASRMAGEAHGALRRAYLAHEGVLLQRMELRAVDLAHTLLAVSDGEARYFSSLGARRVVVVPNGVDCDAFGSLAIGRRPGPPTILYVGSLAWPPNANAAHFLATEVMPAVQQQLPDARLVIVGRDPGPEVLMLARHPQIEVVANAPDVAPYYRDANILAVPLQAGGGTRLKILEAFAAGVPVVSTAVGCEGIDAVDGRYLEIAECPEFATALVRLLRDPNRAGVVAERARVFARERFDWSVVGAQACDAVEAAAAS